jgi:Zn finger protein HypA/HybF involved in hydrogenase expression
MSSIKQHQETNTIRRYHDAQFVICNSCFWCASYLSHDAHFVENCPVCRSNRMEVIPISPKEAYKVNMNGSSISMEFWNQVTI